MDFGETAVMNGDLLLETEKVPILNPRKGLYLKCRLLCIKNMCGFCCNIMNIFVELKRQMRSIIYVIFEHKFIKQAFGKLCKK
jgi:hypothetical protein